MKNVDAHKKGWIALLVALVFLVLPGFFLGAAWPRALQRMLNPFADLPPELRPQTKPRMGNLRQVTCPGCGLKYWTDRSTDLCMDCEKKGVEIPE